jgi:hypothetical protein
MGRRNMKLSLILRAFCTAGLVLTLAGCGGPSGLGSIGSGLFGNNDQPAAENAAPQTQTQAAPESTIWDLIGNQDDPSTKVAVNRYLWNASLEILSFLPIQSVDPFSGVIVTGYGTPPGGGRAYRATILVNDPALDARSLKLALATRAGPVSADTQRAVEDAILTRARQLRIRDGDL